MKLKIVQAMHVLIRNGEKQSVESVQLTRGKNAERQFGYDSTDQS